MSDFMVGSRRLELPTSSVSTRRSNQLSYDPTRAKIRFELFANSSKNHATF